MNAQRARKRHRVGKQPMVRSKRDSTKKKKAEKKIDLEEVAFM